MKNKILFLLFLLPLISKAQVKEIDESISWATIAENQDIFPWTFDQANYNFKTPQIPYYYKLIEIDNEDVHVELKVTSYLKSNISATKYLSVLTDSEINYNIQYLRQKPYLVVWFYPLKNNSLTGEIDLISSFKILITPIVKPKLKSQQRVESIDNSVLRTGTWYKLRIPESGVYKLTYDQLNSMGISSPDNISLYGNDYGMLSISNNDIPAYDLSLNSISIHIGSDGIFNQGDYILFYAKGPDICEYDSVSNIFWMRNHLYANENYYYISSGLQSSPTIPTLSIPADDPDVNIGSYTEILHFEEDNLNLIESGQDWYADDFSITTSRNYEFTIDNVVQNQQALLFTHIAARSATQSEFHFRLGQNIIGSVGIGAVNMSSYSNVYANDGYLTESFTVTGDNPIINVRYNKPLGSSLAWLDFITLNVIRNLTYNNEQLTFRYINESLTNNVVAFQLNNSVPITIWNISNPSNPINIQKTTSSGRTSFKLHINGLTNEFVAFADENIFETEIIGQIENQNLHALNHKDMIIICPDQFLSHANTVANIHREKENLDVLVVLQEQIFNEFSSGMPDATALRNFISMIYHRPSTTDTLKYVLLFGDGSYDNKTISNNNTNFILTYQSKNSLDPTGSFVTDDFFGLLDPTDNVENDNSGLVDIGIGRFPVKSTEEAQNAINKINAYYNSTNFEDWINSQCFVGDDEDNNLHMRDADRLAEFVKETYPYFNISKIYLDAYPQESSVIDDSYPEVNRQINDQINKGTLIFNYTGHGGESGLAHERIMSIDDINSWKNIEHLALFMTATCEFSRFDDFTETTAGEHVFLNPEGGGIALFTTTRLVYSSPNYTLNRNFYNHIFSKNANGKPLRFGDVMRLTKNASGTGNNKRNFTLLGDPALSLPLPQFNIITDSINGVSATELTDTIQALSKVAIHGHVIDNNGNYLNSFNGVVQSTIFDKEQTINTLGNDGGSTMEFTVQNSALYKGKATVNQGRFKFEFFVPKDISYSFGNGKISYYANNISIGATGYYDDFVIGGTSDNLNQDQSGPDIKLYFNDEEFVSGGITDENPTLYASVFDSSGINTVGNGIGHDITAILDSRTNEAIILNDYYETEIDDFQNGSIEYLFTNLENGEHSLQLKVWDVFNNSNEEYIEFIVAETSDLAINNLLNYPNPFTENTSFFFDHNKPNTDLEVTIQIFTISGKLVKTITTLINSTGFRSDPIFWNGLDDFGDKIGRGVYLYRIKVRSVDGQSVEKIEKLVILK